MRTSSIRHPAGNRFVRRYEWQLQACGIGGISSLAETCAEILCIFEWHLDNRYQNEVLDMLVKSAMKKHGRKLHPFGNWLPYSYNYLKELLFDTRGKNQIIAAVHHLETIGFISSDVPVDIQEYYGKTISWYLLEVETINRWIDLNVAQVYTDAPEGFEIAGEAEEKAKKRKKQLELIQNAKDICEFHRHIHAKTNDTSYDNARQNAVKARLREGRSVAQCAQAIIGNLFNEWMRGENPQNKVYDEIENIFDKAKKFENHISYAEEAKVTQAVAESEYKAFLEGKQSKYRKKIKKGSDDKETSREDISEYADADIKRYGTFAAVITPILLNQAYTPSYVLEQCDIDDGLFERGQGITDAELLIRQINYYASQMKSLAQGNDGKIKEFAEKFCEFQMLNMEE